MQNQDTDQKIEIIVALCHKLADLLKDPAAATAATSLDAEARAKIREDAYEDLLTCVDALALIAQYSESHFSVLNIAARIGSQIQK